MMKLMAEIVGFIMQVVGYYLLGYGCALALLAGMLVSCAGGIWLFAYIMVGIYS